jgi:hypothetical protein
MDLGSAASVIAVIDLSAKVASLCFRYYSAVKNARADIERLQLELESLKTALEGARRLLEGPDSMRLQTSHAVRDGLCGCLSKLTELETKLEEKSNAGTTKRAMSAFGIRALKWPFETKEVNRIIAALGQCRDTLSTALTIDHTYVTVTLPNLRS